MDSSGGVEIVTSRETVNFNSAASVVAQMAVEQVGSGGFGGMYVNVALSNGKWTNGIPVACPNHDIEIQNLVTATIGSWSGGSAEVKLSNPNQTTYYVNMPSSGSWSRDYGILGETVYITVGGKTYSHWFSNVNP